MAFGGSQVTRERESGALVSLGDDLKAASTDGVKKCATFLGVGLRGIRRGDRFRQGHARSERPTRLLPAYDSGNHVHPTDAGYQATAKAIDLKLFK